MEVSHTLAVFGNPNSGKTTLFNELTGSRQRTGNWPGVTVERKEGQFDFNGERFLLVDLPGTYSLGSESPSLDELVARDFILSYKADVLINIIDASNLERSLYLTAQLIEMAVPMIVVLNRMDVADNFGVEIKREQLQTLLGCPVVETVATRKKGLEALKLIISEMVHHPALAAAKVEYPKKIEAAIESLQRPLLHHVSHSRLRWQSLQLLLQRSDASETVLSEATQVAEAQRKSIEHGSDSSLEDLIARSRYEFAEKISTEVSEVTQSSARSWSDKIDDFVLNRWLGVPIFLFAMYLMFTFTINVGGAFIDFFDIGTGALLVDGLGSALQSIGAPDWLRVLLADGVGGGIQVVATFVPIIGFLYLFLSLLEDSGYMARAAFVMDRLMRKLGLPGKAFVPLIVGFGCNVPAIMSTRTLDVERERLISIMMAPFMSCGARLSVYALFAAAFFPVGGQNIVFLLYLAGIIAAILTGLLLKSTILQGEAGAFLMELPSYQMPSLNSILIRTWTRLKGFIKDAGKYIVVMVVVINVLNSWGTDGSFGNEDSENSVLSEIGKTLIPAFEPMGIKEDNWPATVGIFTGILAKEVVVGALDSMYSRLGKGETESVEEEQFELMSTLKEAVASIGTNLKDVAGLITDPLGLGVLDSSGDQKAAAEEQEVSADTFSAMQQRFDGTIGAFAYMLFILLYFPCVAATAAIKREAGWAWTMFAMLWTTGLAYMVATFFYQSATFQLHPAYSAYWLVGISVFMVLVYLLLKLAAKRYPQSKPFPVPIVVKTK